MAMGNGYVIDATGRRVRHIQARDFTVRRYLYGGTSWMQQSTFFRREMYHRSSKFNSQNRTCWDGELFVNMAKLGATVGYVDTDLSGFRMYATSISGSGTNQDAYIKDCRRIFEQATGHGWTTKDELLRFLYRTEGFLIRLGSKIRLPANRGPE
jgi:hypothetical protein